MHENNLYAAHNSNAGAIEKFKDDLMVHLNINESGIRVYERCKQLVTGYAKTWMEWGLLEKLDGRVRRTTEFDDALRLQRDRWIAEVRDPALEKLRGDVTSIQSLGIAGEKRVSILLQSHSSVPNNANCTGPPRRPFWISCGR
jgi:hypothetical protein